MSNTDSSKIVANTTSNHGTIGNQTGLDPKTATREQCTQALRLLLADADLKGFDAKHFNLVPVFENSRVVAISYHGGFIEPNHTVLGGKFDAITRPFRKSLETQVLFKNIDGRKKEEVEIRGETNLTVEKLADHLNFIARSQNMIDQLSAIQAGSAPSL